MFQCLLKKRREPASSVSGCDKRDLIRSSSVSSLLTDTGTTAACKDTSHEALPHQRPSHCKVNHDSGKPKARVGRDCIRTELLAGNTAP